MLNEAEKDEIRENPGFFLILIAGYVEAAGRPKSAETLRLVEKELTLLQSAVDGAAS